ncbi:M20 family metallopeptidase [Enterococcus villorum]|uniref:Peptidase M20 domain-containing protein 2 n=2 Tax=Enterococcus villorum TaxID=112904 RepID=A0A511IZV9_9ENTE|nr:M20 family metallopeptidase [Enterococcus villorum]EOH88970.1 amidohydrolase [Enterococcus villorum ATCC 700913]EOW76237.1 peptidase M20D [Enterococcus villorum ATCC 700913]GEL91291.1 peptidase M20 [Enterococcus villorum]
MTTSIIKKQQSNLLKEAIQERLSEYQALALDIHQHPEVSNYEFYSSEALVRQLEKEGFEVKKEVAGHRTGFAASYQSAKPGPVIAFLAEFDALPGIGHACGHNLFGTYSVLAASIIREKIAEIGGEIRVYGTPGEEGGENGSAKGSFVREGFFADVDAALCVHPAYRYGKTTESLANDPVDIKFYGVASHAAAAPEKGVNALEALIQVFNGINALRLQLPKDVNIHGIITDGGVAANVIPEYAAGRFYLRAGNRQTLNEVYQKVENIVKGAALSTGTSYEFGLFQNAVDNVISTPAFDELFFSHAKEAGVPENEIDVEQKTSLGSSDVGNVSQVIPTIQPTVSISDEYIAGHSEEFKAAAKSAKGLASIAIATELLAATALDLFEQPELLTKIKEEHQRLLEQSQLKGSTF